jgi:HPr kinase/phosphorylase
MELEEGARSDRAFTGLNRRPKNPLIEVGDFYSRHADALQMKLIGSPIGFLRKIREPTINRPGLALSGFFIYFAGKRIQVLGNAEVSYLKSLSMAEQVDRCSQLCRQNIPCVVVSRNLPIPRALSDAAAANEIAVFRTPLVTMRFINAATIALEMDFAPTTTEHGSMVDIMGIGTMIRGPSGIGKSECVLGLIERGYSLVSDDVTRFSAIEGRELVGTAPDLTRYHMEVRGLGIINVASIFGVGSIRLEKRLDLVVSLREWEELEEVDRIGLEQEYYEILGIRIPHVTIPVRTGRDLARLVEVGALDQKLKSMGQNSAVEFNQRLLNLMQNDKTR